MRAMKIAAAMLGVAMIGGVGIVAYSATGEVGPRQERMNCFGDAEKKKL